MYIHQCTIDFLANSFRLFHGVKCNENDEIILEDFVNVLQKMVDSKSQLGNEKGEKLHSSTITALFDKENSYHYSLNYTLVSKR